MFDGGTIDMGGGEQASWAVEAWRDLHQRLKTNHQQRSRLDARELDLLLEAEEAGLHRRLGHVSLVEYMMAELDCARHTANEKLRVAHELVDLPLIDREFHDGTLSWTKVRELTRVATCETEEAWLDAIEGMGAHQVQRRVRAYAKGSLPSDPPDPSLATEWVGLEVSSRMAARWRQMRTELDDEADRHLTDEELCERLCRRATTGEAGDDAVQRPAFQLAFKTCPTCEATHQVCAGEEHAVPRAELRRVQCDAVMIGDLDDDTPTPARSTIPAPTRRKVFVRDRFACAVPGCTSRRCLEIHHIVPRSEGGRHPLWNLILLCDGHHTLHHDGVLEISGRAPDRVVFRRREAVPRGPGERPRAS